MFDDLYENLASGKSKLSVVGLGYVGLPLAVAFSRQLSVIGFDTNVEKIKRYRQGIDPTREVGDEAIKICTVEFVDDEKDLQGARFHIVAVPTPVRDDYTPDLSPVESASRIVGRNLSPGSIVVFESTVYPGVTEEICVPILEKGSGLKCGTDFKVGYSPERINPGDKEHRLSNIVKIVSGMDEETLEIIAKVYSMVALAGIHRAESIKVAEAAKVVENSQRDINIAFMNELSLMFHKMDIDTKDVLRAAGTKWNFLPFTPGLVGGHCIGVDPYYLTHKAESMGYHSQVILAGRHINDDIGRYIAENAIKLLVRAGKQVQGAKVAILGITFKENCPDVRNTRVIDIIWELRDYGIEPYVADPVADAGETMRLYGIGLVPVAELPPVDMVIIATAHKEFTALTREDMDYFFVEGKKVLLDVKGIFDKAEYESLGYCYWRL